MAATLEQIKLPNTERAFPHLIIASETEWE